MIDGLLTPRAWNTLGRQRGGRLYPGSGTEVVAVNGGGPGLPRGLNRSKAPLICPEVYPTCGPWTSYSAMCLHSESEIINASSDVTAASSLMDLMD